MAQYNPNDFYPRTGAEIDSNGNVKNDADGLNADGSKTVQIEGTTGNKLNLYGGTDLGDNTTLGNILPTNAGIYGFNGSTWDRLRSIPGTKGILATPFSGMQSLAITTATTTAVKASAGVVGTLINAGTSTSGTITVYDSTSASGKTIWSGTLTAGQVLQLGIPCGTGITIVTGAANTITVSYV